MATKEILMDGDKVCIAWFKKKIKKFILTTDVEPVEGGTITGAGTYDEGTVVPVEAIPNEGWEFDHWGGEFNIGMGTYASWDSDVDTLISNGFTELRMDIPSYESIDWVARSKNGVISAIDKGARIIWGVSTGAGLTAANWAAYRQAVLDVAQWAQDNGVFEFQLGNELEYQIDNDTLVLTQLIANLKSLATDVQAIFTNGNISYSSVDTYVTQGKWIESGRGDIDILACNIYKGGASEPYNYDYQKRIKSLMDKFGADHFYLTEFAPSYKALEHYNPDEAVQATAVTEILNYIKSIGMKRAIFYCLKDDPPHQFGAIKTDGTYRELWYSLL